MGSLILVILFVFLIPSCTVGLAETAIAPFVLIATLFHPFVTLFKRILLPKNKLQKQSRSLNIRRLFIYIFAFIFPYLLTVLIPIIIGKITAWSNGHAHAIPLDYFFRSSPFNPLVLAFTRPTTMFGILHMDVDFPFVYLVWWLIMCWLFVYIFDLVFYRHAPLVHRKFWHQVIYSTTFIGSLKVGIVLFGFVIVNRFFKAGGYAQSFFDPSALIAFFMTLGVVASSLLFLKLLPRFERIKKNGIYLEANKPSHTRRNMIIASIGLSQAMAIGLALMLSTMVGVRGGHGLSDYTGLLGQYLLICSAYEIILVLWIVNKRYPQKELDLITQ